jgi:curved DNA-binding protein CbpA
MASFEDYYEILQVSPSAEPEVIEAAYKKLAQKYHPDVNKSPTAPEKMKKINAAHDVLGDPVQRKRYHAEWLQRKGEKTSYTRTYAPPEPKPSSKSQPRQQQRGTTSKPSPTTKQPSKKRRKITAYIISGLVILIIMPIIFMNTIFSPQYKIAFVSDRDGNSEIYAINADGSNERMLTYGPSLVYNPPVWSPKGTKIACVYWTSEDPTSEELKLTCKHGVMIVGKDGRNQKTVYVWDADY